MTLLLAPAEGNSIKCDSENAAQKYSLYIKARGFEGPKGEVSKSQVCLCVCVCASGVPSAKFALISSSAQSVGFWPGKQHFIKLE